METALQKLESSMLTVSLGPAKGLRPVLMLVVPTICAAPSMVTVSPPVPLVTDSLPRMLGVERVREFEPPPMEAVKFLANRLFVTSSVSSPAVPDRLAAPLISQVVRVILLEPAPALIVKP